MVTLTERKSRFELAHKIPAKQSHWVAAAIAYLLASHKVRSIMPDRGKEFAKHELVTAMLEAEFYFPEPYISRGKGEQMKI